MVHGRRGFWSKAINTSMCPCIQKLSHYQFALNIKKYLIVSAIPELLIPLLVRVLGLQMKRFCHLVDINAQISAAQFRELALREGEMLVLTPRKARVFVES